ncbi:ISXo5 transposase, partial [mine drainage metagenome]
LMQALSEREARRQLGGLVQIGDACLGDDRNNGKLGRGSKSKRTFVITKLAAQGHPLHAVITPRPGLTTQALMD